MLTAQYIENSALVLKGITLEGHHALARRRQREVLQEHRWGQPHRRQGSPRDSFGHANDLRHFFPQSEYDEVVMINLASAESWPNLTDLVLSSSEVFEKGLDAGYDSNSAVMLYACAAIKNGALYTIFTPSVSADVLALMDLAREMNLSVAGKEG